VGGPHERDAHAGIDISAHLQVSLLPAGSQFAGQAAEHGGCLSANQTIARADKWHEVTPLFQAGLEVLAFLLALMTLKHLVGRHSAVRRGIYVGDLTVHDAVGTVCPEAADEDVAPLLLSFCLG